MSFPDPLYTPYARFAGLELPHRIVMAPLTRSRATDDGLPTRLMQAHYAQRAGAALIISEGIVVSPQGAAYRRVPGIHDDAQVAAWHEITDTVHDRGGRIVAQLWHVGRQSHSSVQPDGKPPWAPSPIPIRGYQYYRKPDRLPYETPRELSTSGVRQVIHDFTRAAANALRAGFDGVELHGANGYLIDQFLTAGANQRSDSYGGDIPARARFLAELVESVATAVPRNLIGVRLSPSSSWMDSLDPDKDALFRHVVATLDQLDIGYLHLVEAGVAGSTSADDGPAPVPHDELARLFGNTVIRTGNLTAATASAMLRRDAADLVGFGRAYIANPDLPDRLRNGSPLTEVDPQGLYAGGAEGYITYPTRAEEEDWPRLADEISGSPDRAAQLLMEWAEWDEADLALRGNLYQHRMLQALAHERLPSASTT